MRREALNLTSACSRRPSAAADAGVRRNGAMQVFVVQHEHEVAGEERRYEVKFIGVYSTEELASPGRA